MKEMHEEWDGTLPAIVHDMPNEVYHKLAGISGSGLHTIQQYSPAHYRYAPTDDGKDPRPREIGTALHTALLEPHRFEREYIITEAEDRRAKAYTQAAEEYGKPFALTAGEGERVTGMQQAAWRHPQARPLLEAIDRCESSVIASDPQTAVPVRIRPDAITAGGAIIDVKKARDARERPFASAAVNYGYDLKAAFYCDVWQWATGRRPTEYYLLVVEEQPPHAVMVYTLPDDWMQRGRRLYREALDTYAACLDAGEWPAYSDEIECLMPPAWVTYEMEQEETEGVHV
ncbi:MAG: PD-(D/E)XK nuclease-like domain-containing protein [Halofilum sp. (in: g-proteobacteria)]